MNKIIHNVNNDMDQSCVRYFMFDFTLMAYMVIPYSTCDRMPVGIDS